MHWLYDALAVLGGLVLLFVPFAVAFVRLIFK